jgi:predicted transcriptional regulator
MKDRQAAKARSQMLKQLREAHQETVAQVQSLLKDQKAIQRDISKVMGEGPKTVPEVAEALGLPTHEVFWHLTAMKKYDLVVEDGMQGVYYLYKLAEEAR